MSLKLSLTNDEAHFINELMDLLSPNYNTGLPDMVSELIVMDEDDVQNLAQSIFDKTVGV